MDKHMTINRRSAHWLFALSLSTAALVACGEDDNKKDTSEITVGDASTSDASTSDANVSVTPPPPADAGGGSLACMDKVYSELSDECSACTCKVDPVLAPSCQKPCWDFIACSSAAQAGKCAASAAGGAATRPEFEACTLAECGDLLAVPGAEVVSSYRSITVPCAIAMGGAKAACTDDITKIQASLRK